MARSNWVAAAVVLLAAWFGADAVAADERKLILSLGVSEEYNDNVFFSVDDEIDDYINRLLGGLKVINRTERLDASLSGQVRNNHYADHDELDGLDQYYAGQAGYWLTPDLKGMLDAAYARDTQPDRDIEVTGLVLGTAVRKTQDYGAGIQYQLSEITAAALTYKYSEQRYDRDQFVDFRAHRGGLGFTRRMDRLWPNTTGRLNLNYAEYDYDTATVDYYAATVGMLWQMSEVWHLQIDGGARYTETEFDPSGAAERADEGWGGVGVLTLGYRGEYTLVSLTASHDVGPASGRDGSVERTSGVMDLRYRFAEKAWVGSGAGYYLNRADEGDLASRETDQNTLILRPYLRYDLTDTLFLEASYIFTRIDDNVIDEISERNVYLLKLMFEYPVFE